MSNKKSHWKDFWNNQETALHRTDYGVVEKLFADEINILLQAIEAESSKVLEIGCGSGDLYSFLNINRENYLGIDLSEKLIEIFSERHPDANVKVGDASSFDHKGAKYTLIFSNGVVQYFTPVELLESMKYYMTILEDNGSMMFSNIPYKKLRKNFYEQAFFNNDLTFRRRMNALVSPLKLTNSTKDMGHWYDTKFFKEFANNYGFKIHIFGSVFYPYRFSIGLKKIS